MTFLIVALAILLLCAALALLAHRRPRLTTALGTVGTVAACALAMVPTLQVLLGAPSLALQLPWRAPTEDILLGIDPLSAFFLLPLLVLGAMAAIYGRTYMLAYRAHRSLGPATASFSLLMAAMVTVVVARSTVLFLVAWEAMAMAAFLLMATEHEKPGVMRGAWVYLACTHVGTMLLTAMVILLAQRLGGYGCDASNPFPQPVFDRLILVLALLGFGFKAGLVPLHFWLPAAHAGSPSHVSAILSAVMLKAGVYGVLRISGLSAAGGAFGRRRAGPGRPHRRIRVRLRPAQRDYKRLLAYSSVENIGIIFRASAWAGPAAALHNPWIAALGFGAAILHVWNHATFKSLLFFGAGSVLHATGTRDLERLGGLARRMPRTALALFPAVLAVSALPPFNGFVGEWLLYRGLFASFTGGGAWAEGLALTALAVTGGLAGVAFAKFFGFVFLGVARSPEAEQAHDPGAAMWGPMALLAGLCLALSLGSMLLLPLLDRVLAVLAPGNRPLLALGLGRDLTLLSGLALLLLLLGAGALLWLRRAPRAERHPGTWDCGYARPTTRMQYTRSFLRGRLGRIRARAAQPGAPDQGAVPRGRHLPVGVPGSGRRRRGGAPRRAAGEPPAALPEPAAGLPAHVPALHPHHPGERVPLADHPPVGAGMILLALCALLAAASGVPGLWLRSGGGKAACLADGPVGAGRAGRGRPDAGRRLPGEPRPAAQSPGHPGLPAPGRPGRLVPAAPAGALLLLLDLRPGLLERPARGRPAPAPAVRHHHRGHGRPGGRRPDPDLPAGLGGHGGRRLLHGGGRGPGSRHPARRLDLPGLHPHRHPVPVRRLRADGRRFGVPLAAAGARVRRQPARHRHLPAPAGRLRPEGGPVAPALLAAGGPRRPPSHVSLVHVGHPHQDGHPRAAALALSGAGSAGLVGRAAGALGACSGLLGVAFALAQHDLKRLLAYHCIENIGIILLGLGLGCWAAHRAPGAAAAGLRRRPAARAQPQPVQGPAVPGRRLGPARHRQPRSDALGGLAKPMPWTAGLPGSAPRPSAGCRRSTASSANC